MSELSENDTKKVKSELFHIWKKARIMYESLKEKPSLDDWVKKNITQAYELIDEAMRFIEYEEIFPNKKEETPEKEKNNFLSNQDKRFPIPVAQEGGDQFVTRCILDANMKKRYPVQSDRFGACMSIYNDNQKDSADQQNPGEKFEDPMEVKDPELPDPVKPILP